MRQLRPGTFIKQFKGTDLGKVPKTKLETNGWYVSLKRDGNYIQIHKDLEDNVTMFTSSGKQFFIQEIADIVSKVYTSFIVEAELNINVDGSKLNDRRSVGITKFTTDFAKGKVSNANVYLTIFDILYHNRETLRHICYGTRRTFLLPFSRLSDQVSIAEVIGKQCSLDEAKSIAMELIKTGAEGAFCFHQSHTIAQMEDLKSARSNLAIKIKASNKARLLAVDTLASNTVEGEIGSIVLYDEANNITQAFGGLTQDLRTSPAISIIGDYFNVRYESITDGKYIQGFIDG